MFEKLKERLPKRRRLTRQALFVIILLTLIGSFAVAWDKTMATQRRLDRAVRLCAGGEYEESLKLYKRVIFWWPRAELAWSGKGLCELFLERYDDALLSYSEILKTNPENVSALQGSSWAYERLGRYDDALQCYVAINRIKPGVLNAESQIARLKAIIDSGN